MATMQSPTRPPLPGRGAGRHARALRTGVTIAAALLLVAALLTGAAGASPGTGTAPVREQNVDANGAIRVHETGTADVNVTNSSVPVTVGNFPATQQVAGTVNVGNLPATQQVAGTVNVGNLPATQNVNVVGGSLATTQFVNAALNSGILSLDEISEHRITLDPPIYATFITVTAPEKEESIFRFRATIPGSGGAQCSNTPTNCTVLLLKNVGGTVTQALPFPMRIDHIDVFCLEAGAFLDDCMPEIVVVGLKG